LEFEIYRKPTQTDIIPEKAKDAEINTIQNILCNNDYDINLLSKLPPPRKNKNNTYIITHSNKNKVGYLHVQR
jgi:hypothetical protein